MSAGAARAAGGVDGASEEAGVIVWTIRMDCCGRESAGVADSKRAADDHIQRLERECSFKHSYVASPEHLITGTEAADALARLDAKEAALEKLTDADRKALGL